MDNKLNPSSSLDRERNTAREPAARSALGLGAVLVDSPVGGGSQD